MGLKRCKTVWVLSTVNFLKSNNTLYLFLVRKDQNKIFSGETAIFY